MLHYEDLDFSQACDLAIKLDFYTSVSSTLIYVNVA